MDVVQSNVFIFENKRRTGYDINIQIPIKLFSDAISHGASNETDVFRSYSNIY